MQKLVIWFNRQPSFYKIVLNSLSIAVPFYFSAFLGFYISETQELSQHFVILLEATVFIVWLTIIISISKLFKFYQEKIYHQKDTEKETLYQAYTICDRILTHRLSLINEYRNDSNQYCNILITSKKEIQEIVDAAYQTFESTYGKMFDGNNERTNFEVTFMTKSYIDGNITIPASANKDGRSPASMVLRKHNTQIYDNTVTATIYREDKPTIKIIENTSNSTYQSLYVNQLERIKSSIIFPILSDLNEILGTLVVHCDRPNFFQENKKKFWTDLLEIFAKRIALEKVKLDMLQTNIKTSIQPIDAPPF